MADSTVLVVDDRPENLVAVEAVLEPLGCNVVSVGSGQEALRHLLSNDAEVSVILLDVQMPELDGFETAAQIKDRERTRDIPIIFMTAINRDQRHRQIGYDAGAVDYLFKPVEADVLRAKVTVFLELDRNRRLLKEQARLLRCELEERARAEAALATKAAELERSNEDLEAFCSIVSHDLQEPLRVVRGYVEVLQSGAPAETEQVLARMAGSVERMSMLIRDVLTFARVGSEESEPEEVALDSVVEQALENLGAALGESEADLTIGSLPTVIGHRHQLVQLFQNLLGNAVKFRRPDQPCVVRVEAEAEATGWVIAVEDNGVGIPPGEELRIFDMFRRATADRSGSGVGLALCKRVVERHGGHIWAESAEGGGARVKVLLPVHVT